MELNICGFSLSLRTAFGGKHGQRFQSIIVEEWMPTEIGKSNGAVSYLPDIQKNQKLQSKLKSPGVHTGNKKVFQSM